MKNWLILALVVAAFADIPSFGYTRTLYKEGYDTLGVRVAYQAPADLPGKQAQYREFKWSIEAGGDFDTLLFWKNVKKRLWR